jgi:L-asparagine transporter-like permease
MLVIAVANALIKHFGKKEYDAKDFRISLFTLIVSHIQLLIGLVLYFTSPNGFSSIKANGMGGLTSFARLLAVEHPFVGILAVTFITIGYSKHKKKLTSAGKLKPLAIFYTIALVLVLSRIPWSTWI